MSDSKRTLIPGAGLLEPGVPVVTCAGNRATVVRVDERSRELVVQRSFDGELISFRYCNVRRTGDAPKPAAEPCPPGGLAVLQAPDDDEGGEP
jgi:hypothetical protein